MSCVTCHVSCVTCQVSSVTCHLSLTPTATATDPPPVNSATMHSRLVHKDPKTLIISERTKLSKRPKKKQNIQKYANISNTLFDQKSPVHREAKFPRVDRQTDIVTDIATYRLNWPRGRVSENTIIKKIISQVLKIALTLSYFSVKYCSLISLP